MATHTGEQVSEIALPPLSLYVHIPWCVKKCPYCDFNSHTLQSDLDEKQYLQQLLADLDSDLHWVQERKLESIFIGGGTPSTLTPQFYQQLFDALRTRLNFDLATEITMEANPGTVDERRFYGYRNAGINRLSLGIQSFNPKHLSVLGRIHDQQQAHSAITAARKAGFENINLDLMHGLPAQDITEALEDLEQALSHNPQHLSWYQLTIEPNTAFYSSPPPIPDDDRLWDIQLAGFTRLAKAGFQQYEVSAFSKPGLQAKHNLNYWRFGDYLGIGAGAHGKVSQLTDSPPGLEILRYNKTRQPAAYLKRMHQFAAATSILEPEDLPFEFLMNALRLVQGVDPALFSSRTGLPLSTIIQPLNAARAKGLIEPSRLQATELGFKFLNETLSCFMGD
ncbi:MAG: radical SAM family heme chaperone HemW [Pseudomonadales bacterium]|nr:radical SAM family heme chaperone HemW [Pseudomonadales bacterium]